MHDQPAKRPDEGEFLAEVQRRSGVRLSACYHCGKCSNGCPVAYAMDIHPNVLIRCVQLGLKDVVLNAETLWICASCVTCSTRCPNDIDLAHVMDVLRRISLESGVRAPSDTAAFHEAFLEALRTHGRVHELEMILRYKLKTGKFFEDAALGKEMFQRGRLRLAPDRIQGRKEVRRILDAAPTDE